MRFRNCIICGVGDVRSKINLSRKRRPNAKKYDLLIVAAVLASKQHPLRGQSSVFSLL